MRPIVDLAEVTAVDSVREEVLLFFGRLGAEFIADNRSRAVFGAAPPPPTDALMLTDQPRAVEGTKWLVSFHGVQVSCLIRTAGIPR